MKGACREASPRALLRPAKHSFPGIGPRRALLLPQTHFHLRDHYARLVMVTPRERARRRKGRAEGRGALKEGARRRKSHDEGNVCSTFYGSTASLLVVNSVGALSVTATSPGQTKTSPKVAFGGYCSGSASWGSATSTTWACGGATRAPGSALLFDESTTTTTMTRRTAATTAQTHHCLYQGFFGCGTGACMSWYWDSRCCCCTSCDGTCCRCASNG